MLIIEEDPDDILYVCSLEKYMIQYIPGLDEIMKSEI